jgi:hypothetical protein
MEVITMAVVAMLMAAGVVALVFLAIFFVLGAAILFGCSRLLGGKLAQCPFRGPVSRVSV